MKPLVAVKCDENHVIMTLTGNYGFKDAPYSPAPVRPCWCWNIISLL